MPSVHALLSNPAPLPQNHSFISGGGKKHFEFSSKLSRLKPDQLEAEPCSESRRLAEGGMLLSLFSPGIGIALSNCWEFSAEVFLATFCFIFNVE